MEGFEGVGRGLTYLIRLWKRVEKSKARVGVDLYRWSTSSLARSASHPSSKDLARIRSLYLLFSWMFLGAPIRKPKILRSSAAGQKCSTSSKITSVRGPGLSAIQFLKYS